ncbi:uncharacterized protein VTP21DRAFT_4792 [Calcarisporiella thermophila]|uniref:uncharacterized protein n=1 Tax=Calcarisporiella thermophila TaxID=911321 RepID=UPI0037447618
MSTITKPVIVVVGATGSQGGSVINALLPTDQYQLRGITRNPDSPNAKTLASRGVEVIKANLADPKDLDKAFKGAYAVFAVTNYFDSETAQSDHRLEERQGKNMVDAALKAGVQHFIYSSLEDTEKVSNGKYQKVYHFINKARVEEYLRQTELPFTVIKVGFYYENFINFYPPQKNQDGQLEIAHTMKPDVKLAMISSTYDFGPVIAEVIANRDQYLGKSLDLAGEEYTWEEVAEMMSRISGQSIRYRYIPPERLAQDFPYIASDDNLRESFEFYNEYGFFPGRNFKETRLVQRSFLTFEECFKKLGWKGVF